MVQQDTILSFEQERVWFMDRMDSGNPAYHRPCAFKLTGKLHTESLIAALQAVVDRHDNLRVCFPAEQGVPRQRIRPSVPFAVRTADCSAHLQRQIETEIRRPFDLASDLLVRALLIRVAEEEHILLLTFHHIIFDGWSVAVLRRELAAFYTALEQGVSPALEPLPIQYADYAVQQRKRLTGTVLEDGLRYWRQQLCEPLPTLDLPFAKVRPLQQTFAGDNVPIDFSRDFPAALLSLCRRERLTPFMVFAAALQALLFRYTGQEDGILATLSSGRTQRHSEQLIGLFVNTLEIRTQLAGRASFRELLQQMKETTLEAYNRQELPFAKLVAELNPPRSINRHPFSQIMVNMHNMPYAQDKTPGLQIEEFAIDDGIAQYDITLKITERKGCFSCALNYNTDIFVREAIERMAGHFAVLLQAAIADPETPTAYLPLLTQAERQTLLFSWSGRSAEYPREKSLVRLFEEQAAKTPAAVALLYRDCAISYRELNRKVNQLAHALIGQGVGPGSCVGVCLPRSPEVIISFLAILKAGGAYVPLDPAYPPERLRFIAKNSGTKLVITNQRSFLPDTDNIRILSLPQIEERLAREKADNPPLRAAPHDPAYFMYTSGSTGCPKGVVVPHRGIVCLITNPCFAFVGADCVFLQLTSVSFDVSSFEIYGTLLKGGQLAIVDSDMPSLEQIAAAIRRHKATAVCAAPDLLAMILEYQAEAFGRLQFVFSAGDALPAALARKIKQRTRCRLFNCYGPTEDSVYATMFEVPEDWPAELSVPIGRPLANHSVYILDNNRQPVPAGIPGELYLCGDGLADGYLHNPQLTAERFIANPFPAALNSRLYKTGDVVKWLPDGKIAFIGRSDHQVKIRGCRIELGEIESVLSCHPDVVQAVVTAYAAKPAEKAIAAYVVPRPGCVVEAGRLNAYLQTKLPAYMLPAAFMFLTKMPLTPAGKIDKAALPLPQTFVREHDEQAAEQRNEQERAMLAIWERILDKQPIGMKDSFFALGGHSLLGMRLMADIETTFGRQIPVSTLFTADTAEKLCRKLFSASPAVSPRLVPIQIRGENPPLFCVHALDGEVISFRNLSAYWGEEQPIYGLMFDFQAVNAKTDLSIAGLAAGYVKEIQAVQPQGPYYLAGHSLGGIIAYEMARQLWQKGQSVALLALIDTPNPARYQAGSSPAAAKLTHSLGKFFARSMPERKAYLQKRLRKAWAFFGPDSSDNRRKRAIKKELKKAHNQYLPGPYPGRLTIFRALDREKSALSRDRALGWEGLSTGGITVYESPSSHGEMISRENIGCLADRLSQCIKESRRQ